MKFIPLFVVLFGLGLRHLALWCIYGISACPVTNFFHAFFLELINPLYTFSLIALLPALILTFVTRSTFITWLKFAMWWLPPSAILIAITPSTSNSWMPLFFIGKDTVTLVMAGLFTAISLVIIVWKQFNLGKKLT